VDGSAEAKAIPCRECEVCTAMSCLKKVSTPELLKNFPSQRGHHDLYYLQNLHLKNVCSALLGQL
jgi:hypothetical protein